MVGHGQQASNARVTSTKRLHRNFDQVLESSNLNVGNSSRYKTELCRPYEENGKCKYGEKCQFAHGSIELRTLSRHPKYKTEPCKTFHNTGFCPYGPRCHFIHSSEKCNSMPPLSSFNAGPTLPLRIPSATLPLRIPAPPQNVPPLVKPRNLSVGECTTASWNTESQSSSLSNSPLLSSCFEDLSLDPLLKNALHFFPGTMSSTTVHDQPSNIVEGATDDEVFWFSPYSVLPDNSSPNPGVGYGSLPSLTIPHSMPL